METVVTFNRVLWYVVAIAALALLIYLVLGWFTSLLTIAVVLLAIYVAVGVVRKLKNRN